MDPIEKRKIKSDIWVSWLSLIGVAAAIGFGFQQYLSSLSSQQSDAERTTLEFVNNFYVHEMLISQQAANEVFATLSTELFEEAEAVTSPQEANELQGAIFRRTASALSEAGAYDEAMLVLRYFDMLAGCVDSGHCDERIIRDLLGDEAYRYALFLTAEIERVRRTQPTFGSGVRRFSTGASGTAH